METLHPSEIDLGLDRIQRVADLLGIEKPRAKVITVAGTNGKGSCVASLEKILRDTGNTVGSYTSPHIQKYNERIKINGVETTDEAISDAFARIDAARGEISLTYFEFGTLAAFFLFMQQRLDFWLLEVGLGGRLDAVNLISPDIAVVSSIALDHQSWLGDTREEIAAEKLGILRKGIPCVCAEPDLTSNMVEIFENLDIQTYLINRDFAYRDHAEQVDFSLRNKNRENRQFTLPPLNIPLSSLSAAFQVLALCEKLPDQAQLATSVSQIQLAGRFQKIETEKADIILDVAHNPAACALLAEKLSKNSADNIVAIVGMMKDKQLRESLEPLCGFICQWHVTEFADVARSASKDELEASLKGLKVKESAIHVHKSVEIALNTIEEKLRDVKSPERLTVVAFGSFYTVAAALGFLSRNEQ